MAFFQLNEDQVEHSRQILPLLDANQTCLDIAMGPLFAVKLINTMDKGESLPLAAPCLVINVVSWNIRIQQLEDVLTSHRVYRKKCCFKSGTQCRLLMPSKERLPRLRAFYHVTSGGPTWHIGVWLILPIHTAMLRSRRFFINEATTSTCVWKGEQDLMDDHSSSPYRPWLNRSSMSSLASSTTINYQSQCNKLVDD